MPLTSERVLKPRAGWEAINLQELWSFRELFWFLVWRDIKIRYRQTLLGGLWAVLQPLLAMIIFTFFFHRLAGIEPDGAPYPLFAYAGLVLWTFFSNAIAISSNSLVGNQVLIAKIYFPRIFIPLAGVSALLLDLAVGLALMVVLLAYYDWPIRFGVLWLPLYLLGTYLAAGGIGVMMSALNVQFRDVKYVIPFFVQLLLFASPVIYPLSYVPRDYHLVYALNPMVGLLVGFRASLFGGDIELSVVGVSVVVSVGLFVVSLFLFRRMERRFADII